MFLCYFRERWACLTEEKNHLQFQEVSVQIVNCTKDEKSTLKDYQFICYLIISPLPAKAEGDNSFRFRQSVTLEF
jgi:hypothetical protein